MRTIAPKWTDLAAGYQSVRSLNERLETEFGHAVQAGRKQQFRREMSGWQKKRRVFFVLAMIAPLSIITLCLTAYYRREVACVIVYWVILVGIILVTLAVAGRNYIREVMNRPRQEDLKKLPLDLEQRWWDSLSPKDLAVLDPRDQEKVSFLALLAPSLPETCLATYAPELLLINPAGIWLFQLIPWSGTMVRQEGTWKQVHIIRDKPGKEQPQVQVHQAAPDEEWLQHKNELTNLLKTRLPQQAWTASLIQGGLVFTHPKASLDKACIQGNLAAYGLTGAWVKRLLGAPEVDGFNLEIQLEILDALQVHSAEAAVSARELAEQLYQASAEDLRQSIVRMVI
jgi:hypothetical protein